MVGYFFSKLLNRLEYSWLSVYNSFNNKYYLKPTLYLMCLISSKIVLCLPMLLNKYLQWFTVCNFSEPRVLKPVDPSKKLFTFEINNNKVVCVFCVASQQEIIFAANERCVEVYIKSCATKKIVFILQATTLTVMRFCSVTWHLLIWDTELMISVNTWL